MPATDIVARSAISAPPSATCAPSRSTRPVSRRLRRRDPGRGRADRPDVVGEVGVLEADGLQVHPPSVRVEAVEGEPQGGEGEREVVELAEDRDEARHEVDGADEVAGCRDDGDAGGPC